MIQQSCATRRMLIVDDTPAFIELATELLSEESWIEIVGHARTGPQALDGVRQLRPDLVLMDINLPDMNGLDATRQIKAQHDAPQIIVWTAHQEVQYAIAARAAGADGFIAKVHMVADLVALIHALDGTNPASRD